MEESKTPRRLPSSKKLDAARATLASERRAAHAYAQKAAIESERKARSVLKERSPPKAASPAKAPATAPPKAPVPSPPKVPETAPKPQRVTFSPVSSNPDASPRERRLRVASEQVAADASTVPRPPMPKAEATTEATRMRISKVDGSTASDMVNRRTCSATATSGPSRSASATDSGAFSCSHTSKRGALASNSNKGLVTAAEEESTKPNESKSPSVVLKERASPPNHCATEAARPMPQFRSM